ncbi:MAG: BrnT family toxin [Candidatus Electrothrix sp. AUS4]|nr:BrnT family toxin [Candidatus Electrothrix sp. AUS4]
MEEVFSNKPRIRKAQKGRVQGEDLYYAYGRTDGGWYVFVVFIYKRTREALTISARDMDRKERKYYGKA